jgi:hypothetical protein
MVAGRARKSGGRSVGGGRGMSGGREGRRETEKSNLEGGEGW